MNKKTKRRHLFAELCEKNANDCIVCGKKTENAIVSGVGNFLARYRVCRKCDDEFFSDCGSLVHDRRDRLHDAIMIVEERDVSLRDALNMTLCRFNRLARDSKLAASMMKRSLGTAEKGYCRVCNAVTDQRISRRCFLCEDCDGKHFRNIETAQVKLDIIRRATALAASEKIPLPYAISVESGDCGIDEARERIKADEAEARIKRTDIFDKARRLPGCFESAKR